MGFWLLFDHGTLENSISHRNFDPDTQNLIEFRTDLNSITNQSELEVSENSEVAVAEEHEIRYDGGEDDEFLDELEILLQEMTNN